MPFFSTNLSRMSILKWRSRAINIEHCPVETDENPLLNGRRRESLEVDSLIQGLETTSNLGTFERAHDFLGFPRAKVRHFAAECRSGNLKVYCVRLSSFREFGVRFSSFVEWLYIQKWLKGRSDGVTQDDWNRLAWLNRGVASHLTPTSSLYLSHLFKEKI